MMMELDIIDKEYLMQIIERNGNIEPLLKKYDYVSVASAIKDFIENDYVEYGEENLCITEKGKAEHDKLKMVLQRKHNGWISPKTDEIISKIGEKDIYLPKKI